MPLSTMDSHTPNLSATISSLLNLLTALLPGFSSNIVSVLPCIPAAKCSCLLNLCLFRCQDTQRGELFCLALYLAWLMF